jgi:hypothetical protein
VDVKFKFLAFQIGSPELKWNETVPGYEEVLSFAQVKGVEHVTDACVLVEHHVLLHSILS